MTARPQHYLSRAQFAERIGVKTDTLNRYKLPPPDVVIGAGSAAERHGWTEDSVDAWNAARPGRGRRRRVDDQGNPGTVAGQHYLR